MKYFTFIVFLFSAIILNAQMSMEEISYIPSRSGYYNNLVVKGNVKINELSTHPFDIVTYGSYLKFNVDNNSRMFANISISTGTAVLNSDFNVNEVGAWSISVPGTTSTTSPITLNMNGGSLSVSKSNASSSLQINSISFQAPETQTPTLNIRTEDFTLGTDAIPVVDNLYILGMKIPGPNPSSAPVNQKCQNGYYWQPVKAINGNTYTILACNMSACSNPEGEEACLRDGKTWDTSSAPTCSCTSI